MIRDFRDWTPEMAEAHNAKVRGKKVVTDEPPSKPHKYRAQKVTCPDEETEQRTFAQYCDLKFYGQWFHVPNGGMRSKVEGGKLKAQGVKRGVPDNFIVRTTPCGSVGLVVELKRKIGGTLSDEQEDWLDTLKYFGWKVAVCKGADEAISLCESVYFVHEKGEL